MIRPVFDGRIKILLYMLMLSQFSVLAIFIVCSLKILTIDSMNETSVFPLLDDGGQF